MRTFVKRETLDVRSLKGLKNYFLFLALHFSLFIFHAYVFLVPVSVVAGGAGTAGSSFLTLDVGARAIGMGGAYTSISDEASAIYWNPAGLAQIDHISTTMMRSNYIANISYDFVAYAQRITQRTAVAAALYSVDNGAITRTDIAGNTIGDFHPKDTAYALSVAQEMEEFIDPDKTLWMGVTLKRITSEIVEKAKGWAGDIGILLETREPFTYFTGLTLQNFGQGQQFDQIRENLPTQLKGGFSCLLWNRLLLSGDIIGLRNKRHYLAFGTEYNLMPTHREGKPKTSSSPGNEETQESPRDETDRWWNNTGGVFLRAGFNSLTEKNLNDEAGLTMGLGLVLKGFGIDYALAPMGELGAAHRISLTITW